jgi:hypothetical protein
LPAANFRTIWIKFSKTNEGFQNWKETEKKITNFGKKDYEISQLYFRWCQNWKILKT